MSLKNQVYGFSSPDPELRQTPKKPNSTPLMEGPSQDQRHVPVLMAAYREVPAPAGAWGPGLRDTTSVHEPGVPLTLGGESGGS